jgi:hypothetical protein
MRRRSRAGSRPYLSQRRFLLTEVKDRWRACDMLRAWRFLIPCLPTGTGIGVIYRPEEELRSHYFDARLSISPERSDC